MIKKKKRKVKSPPRTPEQMRSDPLTYTDMLIRERAEELRLINEFLRKNKPTTHTKVPEMVCRKCNKKLKCKHPRFIFLVIKEDGRRYKRTYCEECLNHISQKQLDKMVLWKKRSS